MGLSPGQRVVAVKDIGGIMRPLVPKGSKGVVTEGGGMFSGQPKVLFTIKRFFSNEQVEVTVESNEVA